MISAVILTKNEEKNIERCLNSLHFCDEIIIVDDNSTDATLELAEKYSPKVYKRALNNDFAAQRNYGLEKASGEWMLFIDADEEITTDLAIEIGNIDATNSAYALKRKDFFWKKELKYGETSSVRNNGLIRLVKRNSGLWIRPVHEVFQTTGSIGVLSGYINHYPHQQIKDFLNEINTYSTIRAIELKDQKKTVNVISVLAYPFGKFLYVYFIKRGFLDGPAGFAYAFFMSFHSFLVRAKLYQYLTFHD
jgi:glycosyltransferase involved in cell wall biosynthesis